MFVFVARRRPDGVGPRSLVAELPEGAVLATGREEGRLDDGAVLIGARSTSARVQRLDAEALATWLSGPEATHSVASAARALWARARETVTTTGGVVPLEPGVVTVPTGAAAESAYDAVWVRPSEGSALLPEGALPDSGTLLAPRVRVSPAGDEPLTLEVQPPAALDPDVLRDGLSHLLSMAVDRTQRSTLADEAEAREAEQRRAYDDEAEEEAGVAHVAAAVSGPGLLPPPPPVRSDFLACAAIVGARSGLELSAEPAAVEGREGLAAVEVLARASGVRFRRVHLQPGWWRVGEDALLGYRADGTPVALLPLGRGYRAVGSDRHAEPVTEETAAGILDIAFVFSPQPASGAVTPGEMTRFATRGGGRDTLALVFLGLVAGLVGLAIPLASRVIFDEIVPEADTERLAWLVVVLVAVAIAAALLQQVRAWRETRLEVRAARRLGEATWDRLLSLPPSVAARFGVGDLAGRILGLDRAREILSQAPDPIAIIVASLLVVVVLFVYNVEFALVAMAGGILALLVALALASVAGRRSEQFQERTAEVNGFLLEVLRGLPKLRVAGGEARAFRAWTERFAPAMGLDLARAQARLQVMLGLLNPLGTLLLIGAVAVGGGAAAISVGTFVAFQVTYSQYMSNVGQLVNTVGATRQARPLLHRAAEVLAEAPESGQGRTDPGTLRGSVDMSEVVFRYEPEAKPVLDGLDLHAAPGEFLAVVGRSGCGKSTIVRLLLGFEHPEAGSVLYDDRDLGSLDVAAVRRQLGVVLQDSQLVPGTVLDNIAAGLDIDEEQAWGYAELAAMADDVRAMPMKMQTMVTAGAGAFSGGQRQRLLLARALARRPPVLILDEATSALDNVTQDVVAKNVARLGVTRIVIAHRLSTVVAADRIAVIHDGRATEQGTHDALTASGGYYADLVARQVL